MCGEMNMKDLRVMVIGAHPDDADLNCGGTAIKLARAGARVRFVSVCNGSKGHRILSEEEQKNFENYRVRLLKEAEKLTQNK